MDIMTLLTELKDIVQNPNYSCPNCEFQPDGHPDDEYELSPTGFHRDFNKYQCPDCNHVFQAVFCDCGRGYAARSSFDKVRGDGVTEHYHCECGELLVSHQRR